jgi:RIP metalloprotease RseP
MSPSPSAVDAQEAIADFIKTIRATPDGESLSVSVLRGNEPVDVAIQPKKLDGNSKSIGVMLSPNFARTEIIKADNPIDAVAPAAKMVSTMTKDTAVGLSKFFSQLLSGKDTAGQQISGPIGLIKTGSEIVATNNWSTVLAFAAAVSINLGVANALPLPALDGGQLVFVAIEAITKKKVDQRVQEEVIGVTVLFLIFLSASAAFGDVQSILLSSKK